MAHVRRKFVDFHRTQASPIAEEAIRRIAPLYAVEKEARGSPPERRVALRQAAAAPIFHEFEAWLRGQLARISGKSPLAAAIRYALTACSNSTTIPLSAECAPLPRAERTISSSTPRPAARPPPSPVP